jgi:poly(glycerol-phosphate) alpha-glucosyltransferase
MPVLFPEGRYLSATGIARANSGGQTRAMLLRSRLITAATGAPVDVLCFDPSRNYDSVRAQLLSEGLFVDGMRLLNIFEHYRELGWGDDAGHGEMLEPLDRLDAVDVSAPDGTVWQTSYRDPHSAEVVVNDFRRRDGSVYLRVAPYRTVSPKALPHQLVTVGTEGEIVGRFSGLTQWYHRWLRELTAADERTFLFMDSRYLMPIMAPIDDPAIHLIYLMHNCHLPAPRLWNTPPLPPYRRCLERIQDVGAFVTLTERQRADIELQWGHRTNLAVVPNPVETPPLPTPLPERHPHRVVLVARLEKQKRIQHAILAMERVLVEVPDAIFDIYGSGSRQVELQDLIDKRGLGHCITLRGHDPQARDALWTSSAFLLTSEFEGYPLSILESLGRGCPVICYDVPYGPREQISDGTDGVLVPDGDIEGAAQRVVELLSSPGMVQRMGTAGRAKARLHDQDTFLADWALVLQSVVQRASSDGELRDAEVTGTEATFASMSRWRRTLRPERLRATLGRHLPGFLKEQIVRGRDNLRGRHLP